MPPRKIDIAPEHLVRVRALWESGTGAAEIGRLLGVSAQTVRNRAAEYGWSRARLSGEPAPDACWPAPPPPVREPEEADLDPEAMLARLIRITAREMLRAEASNRSPEAAARTVATLSRSFGNLLLLCERLRAASGGAEEPALDEAEEYQAKFQAIADIVVWLCKIHDHEGAGSLLKRARDVMPPLLPLAEMIVRDRNTPAMSPPPGAEPDATDMRAEG